MRGGFVVHHLFSAGLHQRLRPPESLVRGSHDDTEGSLAKFHLAWEVAWLSSSTTLTMWACFVLGAQILIFPHPKKRADVCSKDWRPAFFHLDAHITCEFCAGPLANTQAGCGLRLSLSAVQGK